ncbi:hypothetical protein [Vibrio agarivorans]|uniref:Uncharacterized protein n=1 Tax=Vibrio agarivorans TaxID=153622 RepID=A0ABT7Y732_9VIBR|nr:hypothetical protein [Vibrio agarivorans]MDN2483862.1 hypothetical protein [Vibrio agarivorans]
MVGKRIGHKVWFHTQYQSERLTEQEMLEVADSGFDHEVVRLDVKTREIALIKYVDFYNTHEPILSRSLNLTSGKVTHQGVNPLILHHKHQTVKPDFDLHGFDYVESVKRSEDWQSRSPRTRSFTSRIGRLDFWQGHLFAIGLSL